MSLLAYRTGQDKPSIMAKRKNASKKKQDHDGGGTSSEEKEQYSSPTVERKEEEQDEEEDDNDSEYIVEIDDPVKVKQVSWSWGDGIPDVCSYSKANDRRSPDGGKGLKPISPTI